MQVAYTIGTRAISVRTHVVTLLRRVIGFLVLCAISCGVGASGFNTRDQNPLLQSYYLPSIAILEREGWQSFHSLFITNTYQRETGGNENLTMDAEIYRYEFSIAYQWDLWRLTATVPLIFYSGGKLDSAIEDFHELFYFPDGGRPDNPDNRIDLRYDRNGQTLFFQQFRDNGLGDIVISLTRELFSGKGAATSVSFGVEAPTGELSIFGREEAIDYGIWLSHERLIIPDLSLYGMIGWSLLDTAGVLGKYVNERVQVIQFGGEYRFSPKIFALLQFDIHSAIVKDSALDSLDDSMQMQVGIKLRQWITHYDVDLFFSEDVLVGSAPDITFGLRVARTY